MTKQNSDNLSKGDVISFVSLLLMGVTVFFGMNFKMLGDKISSMVMAVLIVVFMTVFVFLAAYAKAQNRNQEKWKALEYTMLGLYAAALIPCYLFSGKFFDIQFKKAETISLVQSDIDNINKMFDDYNRKCDSRCSSYQIALEAMAKDAQGRQRIAQLLNIEYQEVDMSTTEQASESFSSSLKGGDYKALESDKKNLETKVLNSFKNWNILFIPQYAAELGAAENKYAYTLHNIYTSHKNNIETNIPGFDPHKYISTNNVTENFSNVFVFSFTGLIATFILGGLGLVKYLFGEKRTVVEVKKGDSSVITEDGGFTIQ